MTVIHWYRDPETETIATWKGGPYVELFERDTPAALVLSGDAVAYDVVNVWDYERDRPTIAPELLDMVVREHLDMAGETD